MASQTLPEKQPSTRPAAAGGRHPFAGTLKSFRTASGKEGRFYSLPALARQFPGVQRLPVSLRIVLESVLRNCDGSKVTAEHVQQLAHWLPVAERKDEIPFVVARVVLQDFTGVPLLPNRAAVLRMAARSASRGTPVKSCSTTRATTNGISSLRSATGCQWASCWTCSAVTLRPSQLRSTDSSTMRRDTGRR